jgi:transposase-like protein/IS1 family transposase
MQSRCPDEITGAKMNLQTVFCMNEACPDKYVMGKGNIVSHGKTRQRCRCKSCEQTFSYRRGTIFYGLRHSEELVTWVVGLVASGCPVAAIVSVFEVDERTVADWLRRAGGYAEAFHHQHMQPLDLEQVQVDEVRLKMQQQIVWIAMALAVGSRLWLGAVCSPSRNKRLARQIITCVYNWAMKVPLVITFDGWSAYPKACRRVFREALLTGQRGAPKQVLWSCLTLLQLVKSPKGQPFALQRWLLQGSASMAHYLLNITQGVGTTLNTAYIERLNATFRAHLACMARRTRCPARQLETVNGRVFLVGCLYNFCWLHGSLNRRTPAMAAGLTDHRWSLEEFLWSHLLPHWSSTV